MPRVTLFQTLMLMALFGISIVALTHASDNWVVHRQLFAVRVGGA
jgi:hypothetical protein